ncbi:hypothetical protein ACA910_009186 [Epithemia clementina (nom. ined.)]
MRSASDPFAKTSQALGRARDRRSQQRTPGAGSSRRGLQEDDDEPPPERQRSSPSKPPRNLDSGSEPAAIPTRANDKNNNNVAAPTSSRNKSEPSSTAAIETPGRKKAGISNLDSGSQPASSSSPSASKPKKSKSITAVASPDHGAGGSVGGPKSLDTLPNTFLTNPKQADPILFYLPRLISSEEKDEEFLLDLKSLLQAAQDDVRLHRGRVQAGLKKDMRLIRTYILENDPAYRARQERLTEHKDLVNGLIRDAPEIMSKLSGDKPVIKGKTVAEMAQLHLQQWQRALEVYVQCPAPESRDGGATAGSVTTADLDWSTLFDLLLDGIPEDQDISQVLLQASEMCNALVESARTTVHDAAEHVADLESSYRIRLEAHSEFSRHSLNVVGHIEEQFKRSGRTALQIGQQLEHAELKRSQCEAASVLIRRWWILESLAEQEAQSGEPVDVMEEVQGRKSPDTCQMDPLYTRPENSLEAARALKQLRAVIRAKGHASTGSANTAGGVGLNDKAAQGRFDLTASLIQRTSDALEQRLLTTFERVYAEGGGAYDFSPKPRPGSMDWRELRLLAQALLLFDSGRNLHKHYVDMVVTSRFPELFQKSINEMSKKSSGDAEFDMDSTRSKLSNLFHRVSDVCTAEFELIAYVFGSSAIITPNDPKKGKKDGKSGGGSRSDWMSDGSEEMALVVARALLQRVISDPLNGLQARINDLLASIDRIGDFDAGAKKLDTFVVIHEKAAGLFSLLKEAADRMIPNNDKNMAILSAAQVAARNAVDSLKGFLTSQELALSNTHRQGYINLELRLLHHDCCTSLDQAGCTLVKAPARRPDKSLIEKGILEEYKAPILPLHKISLAKKGYTGILAGPLKQSVLRQPLIHATDSLARARLMFGTSKRGGETTARVILSIYNQMCNFYGHGFLYPIVETIKEMLPSHPPAQMPPLPFDEEQEAPDLGVSPAFWVALERVHSASKSFDRELWAENREGSHRVWEILTLCGDESSISVARDFRVIFYTELERRGEAAILSALDTLSTHIQWVLVAGGESMMATGGNRIFNQLTGNSGGPYAIPAGSSLDTPNSPAIKSLTYCLRVQFVHVQAALTAKSLASLWTALSMRLYDILVARLLQHYTVSTVGAVILSRDVDALRSVSMLAGTEHSHWDLLRELVTLYMTPPDAIKTLLLGPEGDTSKGLFAKAGRDHSLVFLSRRNDYRYKTTTGPKKSSWVTEMLIDLNMTDPSDGNINIGSFAAGRSALS